MSNTFEDTLYVTLYNLAIVRHNTLGLQALWYLPFCMPTIAHLGSGRSWTAVSMAYAFSAGIKLRMKFSVMFLKEVELLIQYSESVLVPTHITHTHNYRG